jgi:diguanylate cyclase
VAFRPIHRGTPLGFPEPLRPAVEEALEGLRDRTGLGCWLLLQAAGRGWTVLAARDRHYGIAAGDRLADGELPVRPLLEGRGPRVAPAVAEVDAYAGSVRLRGLPVGAFAGIPVQGPDGRLLGCLCGVDPAPTRPGLAGELPTIELLGRLLASLLDLELDRQELQGRFERAELDSLTDPLTGVGNRRAWDRLLDAEEARCRRYGSPASLVAIDLDELKLVNDADGHLAGDRLLCRAAEVIGSTKRAADVVARLGGDEFGVLAVECDERAAAVLAERIRVALEAAGVRASVGHATRRPSAGLGQAWAEADSRMYARKRRRR